MKRNTDKDILEFNLSPLKLAAGVVVYFGKVSDIKLSSHKQTLFISGCIGDYGSDYSMDIDDPELIQYAVDRLIVYKTEFYLIFHDDGVRPATDDETKIINRHKTSRQMTRRFMMDTILGMVDTSTPNGRSSGIDYDILKREVYKWYFDMTEHPISIMKGSSKK